MKLSTPRFIRLAAGVLLAVPLFLRADQPDASAEKLAYVKPAGVTEKARTAAVKVRGAQSKNIPEGFFLTILCPEHTGLTVQEHPSIFWYTNKEVKDVQFKLSVTHEGDPEPLFEKVWSPKDEVGIQRLNLNDIPKPLEPDMDYTVNVTVLVDAKDHSKDLGTSGLIKRVAAPEKLMSKLLARPTPAERAMVYAHQGIWYDALTAISDQIAAEPKNKTFRAERAELLKEGALPEAAAFDQAFEGK